MTDRPEHLITDMGQLQARIGTQSPLVDNKVFAGLEPVAAAFIRRSPFLLFGTVDPQGQPDLSPKGDDPGFVRIDEDGSLLVPNGRATGSLSGSGTSWSIPESG
jgi:hypothetical protein